jgi:PAS domain S-box-containing protein
MLRVLYVDDDHGLLEIGKLFLEQTDDFSVVTIDSASAALDLIRHEQFQAVVSDYQMPGLDGIEFLKEIRGSKNTVPFILFTGKGREEVVIQALNEGADFYLQKGGDPEAQFVELVHKIRQAIGKREAEKFSRDVISCAREGIVVYDKDLHILLWNKFMEDLTGIPAATLLGKNAIERFPFHKVTGVAGLMEQALSGTSGESQDFPFTVPSTGKSGWVRGIYSPHYDTSGTITGVIGIIRDVTHRWVAEQALRESEEKYRTLAEDSEDYIMRYDRECRHLYMNPAALRVSGLKEQDVIGKTHHEAGYDASLSRSWEEKISHVFETGEGVQFQFAWESAEGTVFLDWKLTPEYAADGSVQSVLGVSRDITKLKQVEKALEESESRLNSIISVAPVGIGVAINRVMQAVNDQFCQITGYTKEELIGKPARMVYPTQDDCDYVGQEKYGQIASKGHGSVETRFQKKDGTIIDVLLSSTPIDPSDLSVGVTFTALDITDRKRAERALAESELRYRHVVEDQTEFICRFLPDGTHIFVNEAYCHYFGLKKEEIIGTRFRPTVHPDDKIRVSQCIASLTIDHPLVTIDQRIIMQDGSTRWQRWVDRAIFNPDGSLKEYQSVGRDITDWKQMEEALRQSELKHRGLVENALVGIFETALDGTLVSSNTTFARMYGYSDADEMVRAGVNVGRDLYSRQADRTEVVEALRKTGYMDFREFPVQKRDKCVFWVAVSARVVKDGKGNILNFEGVCIDITGRKRAEQQLIQSEERFSAAFNFNPDPVAITDIETGNLIDVNPAFSTWSGYTRQELIGKTTKELNFWVDPSQRDEIVLALKTRRDIFEKEVVFRKRGGEKRTILFSMMFITIGDNEYLITRAHDLTDLLALKQTLADSEAHLASAQRLAHLGSWTYNLDENRITWTEETFRIYDREIGLGEPEFDELVGFFHPDDRADFIATVTEALEKGNPYEKDWRIVIPDDGIRVIRAQGEAIFTNGKVTGLWGTVLDITDRKLGEQALRESEEKYRDLVDNIHDIIWQTTADLRFTYVSPSQEKITGFPREELLGKSLLEFTTEESVLMIKDRLAQRIAESKSGTIRNVTVFEVEMKKKDGTRMWVETGASPIIGPDGTIQGFRGISREITDRKHAEDALRKANQQLGLLGSITRHDINNKLSVILGYLRIAQKKSADPSLKEYFDKMESALKAIQSQIDFTRLYKDLGSKEPQWQDLDKVLPCSEIPSAVTLISTVQGIDVYADPMLGKVFFNLLDNSIRHGDHVTEIRVSAGQSDKGLIMLWEDNGIGIPADEKEEIFNRGFGKNTGLGLFLVREILALTGAGIMETGEEGKGARFEILVPNGMYRSRD